MGFLSLQVHIMNHLQWKRRCGQQLNELCLDCVCVLVCVCQPSCGHCFLLVVIECSSLGALYVFHWLLSCRWLDWSPSMKSPLGLIEKRQFVLCVYYGSRRKIEIGGVTLAVCFSIKINHKPFPDAPAWRPFQQVCNIHYIHIYERCVWCCLMTYYLKSIWVNRESDTARIEVMCIST